MDITRTWRLKTTRTEIIASRCPTTGELLIPQSIPKSTPPETYSFTPSLEKTFMHELNPPITTNLERAAR